MKTNIGPFKLDTQKTTMKYGSLYVTEIDIPFAPEGFKKRKLRVWLPNNYDGVTRFPTLYMSDGQNIVNKYTTCFGDWNLSEVVNTLQTNGHQGVIIVGLDCAEDENTRIAEYSLFSEIISDVDGSVNYFNNYGDKTAELFVTTIKELIDNNFMTKPDRENAGFMGSSMGGIFAFYICTKYPKILGFCGGFSPAYHIYSDENNTQYLNSIDKNSIKESKFYLYSGNSGYEANYPKPTKMLYEYLMSFMSKGNVAIDIDEEGTHSEASWNKHSGPAIEFMIPKK